MIVADQFPWCWTRCLGSVIKVHLSYRVDQWKWGQHLVIGLAAECKKPCLSAHYKARYQHFWLALLQSEGGSKLNYQVSSHLWMRAETPHWTVESWQGDESGDESVKVKVSNQIPQLSTRFEADRRQARCDWVTEPGTSPVSLSSGLLTCGSSVQSVPGCGGGGRICTVTVKLLLHSAGSVAEPGSASRPTITPRPVLCSHPDWQW